MDGSVSQSQGRLQCLIVCINCVSMFTEYPGAMCVRSLLLRTAYTQWRRGAARSVYQRADSLQSLNLSLSIMDHRLEKSFCVV